MAQTPTPFSTHFIAGGLAGTIGASVTCPLEVVKTRLQSSLYRSQEPTIKTKNPVRFAAQHVYGVGNILSNIYREEGLMALWKGLGPTLVGVVPARAIYFGVYNRSKFYYTNWNGGNESSLVHLKSAATAGLATTLVTNPIWLVKTRMQLQSELVSKNNNLKMYKNSLDCLRVVLKEEGIRGLYRGLSASIVGLSESSFQFVMYEWFKKMAIESKRNDKGLAWWETIVVSSGAKLIAAVATYPHEVIRTRMRQSPENGIRKYRGFIQSGKLIYQQEGVAALYGGMAAHLLRVVPNAAILFLSYEVIISLVTK